MMKHFILGIIIMIVFFYVASSVTAQPWNLRVVDDAGNTGHNSQIAVTSDGTPYILYVESVDDSVYLAWWVPSGGGTGGWNHISIDRCWYTHRTTALVADAYDNLHLAFDGGYSNPNLLRYAVFDHNTKSWVIPPETAVEGNAPYKAMYTAVGVVDNGGTITPTIAYADGPWGPLKYATRDPITGTWSSGPIYTNHNVGTVLSMAVDSAGRFWLSFYEDDGNNLMYATRAPGEITWGWGYVDIV
ncbi:hypothetical protein KAR91_18270 [Candidatus Pacearchaeota archaeon]|nr:hypothetical protein [Candidatus Pacearchaeota archaeon]